MTRVYRVGIVAAQLKQLLGLIVPSSNDVGPNLENFFGNLGQSSWRTAVVSIVVAAALILAKREWRGRKLPREFPTQFVVLTLSILISWAIDLPAHKDVPMVGAMPAGFPTPVAPDLSVLGGISGSLTPALVIAAIAYAQSIGVAITYARESRENLDCDQELIAMGAASIVSGFFGGFAQSASLTRSAITARMGGRTPMANAYSAVCAIIALLFVGPTFRCARRRRATGVSDCVCVCGGLPPGNGCVRVCARVQLLAEGSSCSGHHRCDAVAPKVDRRKDHVDGARRAVVV
jgi:MFS superfamily sulfate permease-like transporter